MPYFVSINDNNINNYFSKIALLFMYYRHFLLDDFSNPSDFGEFLLCFIKERTPFFWVVCTKNTNEFAGFIFLDSLVGNAKQIYSAEITICFKKEFWGSFTKRVGVDFIKYCFENLNLQKIRAGIYSGNNRVKNVLKIFGFKKEGELVKETLRYGKPQNIELYGLINPKIERKIYENRI
jgi:RimJ/RimL family protein N-acetyltransferase